MGSGLCFCLDAVVGTTVEYLASKQAVSGTGRGTTGIGWYTIHPGPLPVYILGTIVPYIQ